MSIIRGCLCFQRHQGVIGRHDDGSKVCQQLANSVVSILGIVMYCIDKFNQKKIVVIRHTLRSSGLCRTNRGQRLVSMNWTLDMKRSLVILTCSCSISFGDFGLRLELADLGVLFEFLVELTEDCDDFLLNTSHCCVTEYQKDKNNRTYLWKPKRDAYVMQAKTKSLSFSIHCNWMAKSNKQVSQANYSVYYGCRNYGLRETTFTKRLPQL